jgi:hypothetical protein
MHRRSLREVLADRRAARRTSRPSAPLVDPTGYHDLTG